MFEDGYENWLGTRLACNKFASSPARRFTSMAARRLERLHYRVLRLAFFWMLFGTNSILVMFELGFVRSDCRHHQL
jgi:hypothetical protein